MSCSGCRILRKGCSENCMLRHCLQWIDGPQAQANATVFVAKFFGRAGLMSFISAVPETQRPALFQSLLYEAVGRTVNTVSGAVGLLLTGNWHVCQTAVETVLCGGELHPLPDVLTSEFDDVSESGVLHCTSLSREVISVPLKRNSSEPQGDLDLTLTTCLPSRAVKRPAPSPSEESKTTTSGSGLENCSSEGGKRKLLRLFL
ncbi:LOB domain-containing protein 38-like isoform X1 [Mangifera indica]|uniref:LOB domain-containing protein 38-like isoform X1 n=1 Tax=Mangifera indica TaxID=29780 RepID=UPI001CFA882F|nr:LOB domain-containing protein 38-like isoform X1 [Mangifera indica]